MQNNALRHVPVGTVCQLNGAPLHHFTSVVLVPLVHFWTGSFLIVGWEDGGPFHILFCLEIRLH